MGDECVETQETVCEWDGNQPAQYIANPGRDGWMRAVDPAEPVSEPRPGDAACCEPDDADCPKGSPLRSCDSELERNIDRLNRSFWV